MFILSLKAEKLSKYAKKFKILNSNFWHILKLMMQVKPSKFYYSLYLYLIVNGDWISDVRLSQKSHIQTFSVI